VAVATAPAHATAPCAGLTKAEFVRKVLQPSDLVVVGTVSDFSTHNANDHNVIVWTKVKIDRMLKGNAPTSEITINGWQASDLPMYGYNRGSRLFLLLKKQGHDYQLTDSNWAECVPSVIEVTPLGKVYPFIGDSSEDINKHRGLTIDEFTHYLF